MVCVVRNGFLPILEKQILVDGKTPSVRQEDECLDEFQDQYQQYLNKDDTRSTSGDEDGETDGTAKTFDIHDFRTLHAN
jgi:hypothetical protein